MNLIGLEPHLNDIMVYAAHPYQMDLALVYTRVVDERWYITPFRFSLL